MNAEEARKRTKFFESNLCEKAIKAIEEEIQYSSGSGLDYIGFDIFIKDLGISAIEIVRKHFRDLGYSFGTHKLKEGTILFW